RPARFFETPIAIHLIGYLDGDGNGAAGMEKSYNDILADGADKTFVRCTVTASGGLMQGTVPELFTQPGSGNAVQLTLSLPIQRICEGLAKTRLKTGAVLVLDTKTGEILGLSSVPEYDPLDVAKSIQQNDTALLCRALCAYNVGSVFKPIVAAAALESGIDPAEPFECTGEIEVAGHIYHCANNKAHGSVALTGALGQSCNCYFIELAERIGAKDLSAMARKLGFGRATMLWDGFAGAAGNLPSEQELMLPGELASFGFGQGKLLATPIQLAASLNAIANGGIYKTPTAVRGVVNAQSGALIAPGPARESFRVLKQETAATLNAMLEKVVTEGIASAAAPDYGTAGGKTGTAQTGRKNAQGSELCDAWFAGFYPAIAPRYTIVLMEDSTTRSGEALAPVFAELCNNLALLEKHKIPCKQQ
ncbi:MAG: penicillin-binding protein 2, partial [Pygmaiobacter sp.]